LFEGRAMHSAAPVDRGQIDPVLETWHVILVAVALAALPAWGSPIFYAV
jgi:hypothetical protein